MTVSSVLKSKLFWLVATPVLLLALYAFAGFKLAPQLLRGQAQAFVRENYDRELTIGEVRIQPFKLQLEVRDLALPDRDGEALLAAQRLYADFELASLWKRTFIFKEVLADGLFLRPVVRPDGSVNLADLVLPDDPNEPDEPLPALLIQRFELADGKVDFLDQARRKPFRKVLSPLNLRLDDFRTTPEGGEFSMSAQTENAESIEWQGSISLEPRIASSGNFAIENLDAVGLGEYLEEALPFALAKGLIDLAGSYQAAVGEQVELLLKLPTVAVQGLVLRSREAEPVVVEMPAITVSDVAVSLQEQLATIGRIGVARFSADTTIDQYGSILLMRLIDPPPPAGASAGATPPPAAPVAATNQDAAADDWRVEIAALELSDGRIGITDQMIVPGTRFELAPFDLTLSPVTADLGKPIPVAFKATIDATASLTAEGTFTLEPYVIEGDIDLSGMSLAKLQPYALAGMDLQVRAGTLATKGRLRLEPPEAAGPEVRYAGELSVANLKTIDNALKRDLFNAERIEVTKLDYAMGPDSVGIEGITLRKPYASVILSSDQVLNLAAVLDPAGTAKALAERKAQAAAEAGATKGKRSKAPQKRKQKKGQKSAPPPPPAPTYVEGLPIRIGELRIVDGTVDFADFFVQPNFQAKIFALDGSVTGMSSKADSRAKIALQGKVDQFSPVTVAGELQPFAFDRYTDMTLKFENISLPVLNPYSGRLAGYNIAKGKLTTELDYLIQDRALDAKHKVRIDQLEWGEKSATQGEATLPVKLATSLLKDRNGVIALDLPVTGTLDDPKFRIGPIVWQIIKNVLTKVVTAPFAMFGSMFKGAEQAQFIDFAPGEAELPPASTAALQSLAAGLSERPAVRLDIPVVALAELDRPALAERAWTLALQEAWRKANGAAPDAPVPEQSTLDEAQRAKQLAALIEQRSGAAPVVPEPPAAVEGASREATKAAARAAELEYLERTARALVVVDEAEFGRLAEQRARAIQAVLLTDTKLEPTRVFLSTKGKVAAHEGQVRLELGIE
jgi:hypothetical protein